MRLDCCQHDHSEEANPRHEVTKSTHHHVPLLHIRVHPIVGNPHDCHQDTMLDNVLPFYPPKVVSTRQRCCSHVWSAVIASPTLYIYSKQSLHICQQEKELFDTFFSRGTGLPVYEQLYGFSPVPGKKNGPQHPLQPSIQPEQFLLHHLVQLVRPILSMVKLRLVKPEVMVSLTNCVKV